jgi:ubiquinone/menaquinone biosynthesis C-methylase UbiE
MRRVAKCEARGPALDRSIRAYWNARIHDTPLSDDPRDTAPFFAALDDYRLSKNPYLGRVVQFEAWSGRDVLEIGCGAGLDLVRFARGGARATGVDIAAAALDLAQAACAAAGVQATLVEADGARLPFPDASFDFVYCHGVLSFARDPAAIVREVQRVLRPRGQAILMVYNRHSWMSGLLRIPGGLVQRGHADAPSFRPYTRREFARILEPLYLERFVFERPPPFRAGLQPLSDRWLRPLGWHLLAICRRPG